MPAGFILGPWPRVKHQVLEEKWTGSEEEEAARVGGKKRNDGTGRHIPIAAS